MMDCKQKNTDPTDAAAYARSAAKGTIADLRTLLRVADGEAAEVPQRDLEAAEVGAKFDDHELQNDNSELIEEAEDRLVEWPLAVEATTTFEVVLGTGGPDTRLCFECDMVESLMAESGREIGEIRRVFYRYSWEGSAEVELRGEDREVAEAFARHVVPELAE